MPEPPPSPALDNENVFDYLVRHVTMLRHREEELGAYPGDGLTALQADEMLEKIRIVSEWQCEQIPPSPIWDAFRAAVDGETAWLFEDRDPIGAAIAWACRQLQESLGTILERTGVIPREELEKYVTLALVAQGAQRQVALGKGGFSWRLAFAHLLYWLGGGLKKSSEGLKKMSKSS